MYIHISKNIYLDTHVCDVQRLLRPHISRATGGPLELLWTTGDQGWGPAGYSGPAPGAGVGPGRDPGLLVWGLCDFA